MQGMENGISQKKENRLKTISMHIAAIGLVSAIVSFLIDFFSSK
jgi:hypothetical protein